MRLAVVTGSLVGAEDFVGAVWPGGEDYVGEAEAFKRMIHGAGGGKYKGWWLLRPSVIRHVVRYGTRFGHNEADISEKGNQMLGGTAIVEGGRVTYSFKETAKFDNGSAADILEAARKHRP